MVQTRFWNAEVRISPEMYENSDTAMCILRFLGIFPLEVKRKAMGLFLKFNPLYALYSCLIGAGTLSAIYYRIYEELKIDKKPTHTMRSTDKFVRFTAVNAFCLIVFYAVFIMPTRLLVFFKYIRHTLQVDNIIEMRFSNMNRYKSICMLAMPLMYNLSTEALDLYTNYRVSKGPLLATLKRNFSYYTTYIIAFAVICVNRYIANCLEIRVIHMNHILNEEYLNIKKEEEFVVSQVVQTSRDNVSEIHENPKSGNRSSATSKISKISGDTILAIHQNPIVVVSPSHNRASIAITKVTKAYLIWLKAAHKVTDLFGIIITVAMVAILCQMVASKYFIIVALEGNGRDIFEVFDWTAVFSVQIIRLLLIIEPWHSCMVQLSTLKQRVCNLLALNLDNCCRKKIDCFAMVLSLRQYQFAACGLFIVDRLLYTTLIDTVVTFLVISLQAEQEDTN